MVFKQIVRRSEIVRLSPVDRFISVIPSIQSIYIAVQKFRVIIIKIGTVSQAGCEEEISHCLSSLLSPSHN